MDFIDLDVVARRTPEAEAGDRAHPPSAGKRPRALTALRRCLRRLWDRGHAQPPLTRDVPDRRAGPHRVSTTSHGPALGTEPGDPLRNQKRY